ncbi:TetR/AcrR family transcriptional regulator [Microbacterium terricola]|uniref:TetR/AcrR family transcriptional regulator n=1 Tax=Microbacterium terricola TaxID=344163 RepID=UPI0021E967E9|nr:TetR/AcrR family transcriptional regulator [Microbacterium terricola]UYK40382.1 TetR/AcrR family transcriptional regulator [Microbacterium terricola]
MAETRRGNYAAGRARRDQILDAAAAKFAEKGYAETSLAEIAREAGLTTPGLTHHFPSKLHLLIGITERRFDLAAEIVRKAPPDRDGLGPLRLMLGLAETFAGQPALIELFVLVAAEAADPNSPARSFYEERYAATIAELVASFEAGVRAGRLRDDLDYRAIAQECIAISDGLQLQWVITNGSTDILAIIRSHLERLALTILAPGNPATLYG